MFSTFSESIKSGYSFSTVRRLYNQGLRDSRPVFAAVTSLHSTRQSTSGISNHCHERKCRRVFSSSSGSKDKSDKGSGNQWSCPKCGNPCTTVERKLWVTHLLSPGFHFFTEPHDKAFEPQSRGVLTYWDLSIMDNLQYMCKI